MNLTDEYAHLAEWAETRPRPQPTPDCMSRKTNTEIIIVAAAATAVGLSVYALFRAVAWLVRSGII